MVHPQASVVNLQISAVGQNHKLEARATASAFDRWLRHPGRYRGTNVPGTSKVPGTWKPLAWLKNQRFIVLRMEVAQVYRTTNQRKRSAPLGYGCLSCLWMTASIYIASSAAANQSCKSCWSSQKTAFDRIDRINRNSKWNRIAYQNTESCGFTRNNP